MSKAFTSGAEQNSIKNICKTRKKTQMCIMDFWTQREGEGGMIWENDILTCILSCKK